VRWGGTRTSKLNQWLKRPLLHSQSIEAELLQREIRVQIVSLEYIVFIVSTLYAPDMHQEPCLKQDWIRTCRAYFSSRFTPEVYPKNIAYWIYKYLP